MYSVKWSRESRAFDSDLTDDRVFIEMLDILLFVPFVIRK